MECSKCGVSGDKARLFDAISRKGIVKLCEACSSDTDIPVIRKPTTFQLKESERKPTVYNRLARTAGIQNKKIDEIKQQETTLRDIVDKNYQAGIQEMQKPRPDLVENFHWVIMRARRSKHLTPKQLAEEIHESEAAIKIAERAVLPEDDNKLINKLEVFLDVNLIKKKIGEVEKEQIIEVIKEDIKETELREPTGLFFDPLSTKNITISDLQGMKVKREEEIFENSEPREDEPEFVNEDKELLDEDKELSDGEVDDIIYGRK